MPTDLGERGPILGNDECKHEVLRYYQGIEGLYAVCGQCFGHFWDPEIPDDAKIIDLVSNAFEDE